MATKNLTFKSFNLGENVQLMLSFVPPGPGLFVDKIPIAWKVSTLGKNGSVVKATWQSTLGFCTTQITNGAIVTAGSHIGMKVGEVTTLGYDDQIQPPVYNFSTPTALANAPDNIRCINNTGHPANIGVGFVTNPGTNSEEMNPAIMYKDVGHTMNVTAKFEPVLCAYIALDYKESEMLRAEIQAVKPIWTANLLALGPNTTIVVKKTPQGGFAAEQLMGNFVDEDADAYPMFKGIDTNMFYGKRVLDATLSFASPDHVVRSLSAIANQLLTSGYTIKCSTKPGDTNARLTLALPFGTSCSEAEKAVLSITETPGFPGRAVLVSRAGELQVRAAGRFVHWADIGPASPGWHFSGKPLPFGPGPVGYGGAVPQLAVGDVDEFGDF